MTIKNPVYIDDRVIASSWPPAYDVYITYKKMKLIV